MFRRCWMARRSRRGSTFQTDVFNDLSLYAVAHSPSFTDEGDAD